jgi:hypothetical protein
MNPISEDTIRQHPDRPAYGRHRGLAEQFRRARVTHFGDDGVADLSRRLGVPERTWRNYEAGVSMPADVVLRFMKLTGVTACELLQDASPVADEDPGLCGPVRDGASAQPSVMQG